jgi:dipeptidyl aminopeptidase/acylaminoacyl peptidase
MTARTLFRPRWAWLVALAGLVPAMAQAQTGYQKPPKEVLQLLNAPSTPVAVISPTRTHVLLVQSEKHPPIAELARPMLGLAGLRIDPKTNGPHTPPRYAGLSLLSVEDGKQRALAIPPGAGGPVSWSPVGDRFAFTNTAADAVELWLGDVASGQVRKVAGLALNATTGASVAWLPHGRGLLVHAVVKDRPAPPETRAEVGGPVIQESAGKPSPVRTFQDLLHNEHDAKLFDHYATAQLVIVDPEKDTLTPLGPPGIYSTTASSPDGQYLLVTRIHRPYSYQLPYTSFPQDVEVWDRAGKVVHTVAKQPLADRVPIEGVRTGPRQVHWRPTEPATLVWAEALDGGDPRKKVAHRDRLVTLKAPFAGEAGEFARVEHRFTGLQWLEGGRHALVKEVDRNRKWGRTFLMSPGEAVGAPKLVWDLSVQDAYKDPGAPVQKTLPTGHRVVHMDQGAIFLIGEGATPQGDRPFLDRLDLGTQKTARLFQSPGDAFEKPMALLAVDGSTFLTRHESPTEPPNYVRVAADGKRQALTDYPDPAPALRGISRQLVTYERADGVPLSFTLYLPPGHKKGERLPAVVWAYPREFVDPTTAGQVVGSPQKFTSIGGTSHLFFLTQGYAVLDGATMPVVGDPATANNTFVEQVVASARAAIDKADAMGVIDRKRVGVGGHSYGAFMTANLLAHSDLFRAGIARSGAYNRTLTPFGFQNERRTLWEAPEVYLKMSPLLYAHRIKAPLLLVHGAADNNPGTFPMQSERLFQAIKGNGGTVRFISLPHEAHGYLARESVEHTLYEMIAWFDQHVKKEL